MVDDVKQDLAVEIIIIDTGLFSPLIVCFVKILSISSVTELIGTDL